MNDAHFQRYVAFGGLRAGRCPVFLSSANSQELMSLVPLAVGAMVTL